jgi:hypothetical protein
VVRIGALLLGLLLTPIGAAALDCTPVRGNWLWNGTPGCGQIPCALAQLPDQIVAPSQFWVVTDAMIDQAVWSVPADTPPIKYDLTVIYVLHPGEPAQYYSIRAVASQTAGTTPVLSWAAPGKGFVLQPGEKLGVRTAGIPPGGTLSLVAAGWVFPIGCLGRWLGMDAPSATGAAPDFSALVAATTSLQTAAAALQAAIPRQP